MTRAQALADSGDLDGAEAALRAAAQQFPRYAPAFVAIGALDERRGNLEAAVTAFGRAVDIDGDRADSWYALGDALARLGRTEPARDALRRALTLGIEPLVQRPRLRGARAGARRRGRVDGGGALVAQGARPGGAGRGRSRHRARLRARAGQARRSRGDRMADARGAGADARGPVIVEAAAATVDHEKAEALLREGLARAARRSIAARGAGAAARPRGPHRRGDRARRGVRGGGARRDRRRWARCATASPPPRAGTTRCGWPPTRPAWARRRRSRFASASPSAPRDRAALAALAPIPIPSPREAGRGLGRGAPPKPTRPCATHSPRSPPGTPANRRSAARPPRARAGGARLPGARPGATAAGGPARRAAHLDVRPVHDHAARSSAWPPPPATRPKRSIARCWSR